MIMPSSDATAQQSPARVSSADVVYYKTLFPPDFVDDALADGTLVLKNEQIGGKNETNHK
jgi:hypothetical protein